ncbi:hypothetical protein [Salipaludibacillus daqingensis]|uniref:hypothetical protein n=1 Tax=Salipaludibacillus daqingensis TaxID=3041001 RepID=UPI002476BD1B|nr:hypothetical protein [Salipaludibacillus daqingensis]
MMQGVLKRSFQENQPLEMIYMSAKGLVTKRRITVHYYDDEWVKGYCHLRKGVRSFKRLNILSILPMNANKKRSDYNKFVQ